MYLRSERNEGIVCSAEVQIYYNSTLPIMTTNRETWYRPHPVENVTTSHTAMVIELSA